MDFIIKLVFVLFIFIQTWFFQLQNDEWDITRSMLKDANNMAVHDASMELDTAALALGDIIINRDEAMQTFTETLEANLGLDANLIPRSGSRIEG